MKKIFSIICILALVIFLGACGNKYVIKETKTFRYLNKVDYPSEEKASPYELGLSLSKENKQLFDEFSYNTFKEIYESGKNCVYSPASLYIAMAMLAEGASGSSLDQISSLIGDEASRRKISKALYELNYYKNKEGEALLANSYWVKLGLDVKEEYINNLNDNYYATGFASNFDDETKSNMAKWINDNTRGLLDVKKDEFDDIDDMVLCLINTIYFDNKWNTEFKTSDTYKGTFYTDSEVSVDFMKHKVSSSYYKDEYVTMGLDSFKNGNGIRYIMPSDNYTIEDAFKALKKYIDGDIQMRGADITYSVPKFKYLTKMNLIEPLQKLGVTDIFNSSKANFSNISDTPLYVSKSIQNAGIEFSESGVKAAAFTFHGMNKGAAAPQESVNFVLDHPFIYQIYDVNGCVLFMGVVNNPNK